jgi:hypothetical protein
MICEAGENIVAASPPEIASLLLDGFGRYGLWGALLRTEALLNDDNIRSDQWWLDYGVVMRTIQNCKKIIRLNECLHIKANRRNSASLAGVDAHEQSYPWKAYWAVFFMREFTKIILNARGSSLRINYLFLDRIKWAMNTVIGTPDVTLTKILDDLEDFADILKIPAIAGAIESDTMCGDMLKDFSRKMRVLNGRRGITGGSC